MSYTLEPPPTRLHIWQQNLNKSDKAHFDLINTPVHKDWDLLLLQEPYIDAFGNTKATSKWHVIYPLSHLTDSSTCRAVILVNTALDTNSWSQVPFKDSNNVIIIQLRLLCRQLTIFNIYNDCTHSDTLAQLHQFLGQHAAALITSKTDHMVWCGNFNQCTFDSNSYTEYESRALRTISRSVGNSVFGTCIISLIQIHNPKLGRIPSMRRSYDVIFVPKVD